MNGDGRGFSQVKMKEILKTEFLIPEDLLEQRGLERAAAALEAYDSMEEFLDKTGWGRDNPECSSEAYLTGNRICRWVDGKLFYFSRILWENTGRSNMGDTHI